MSRAQAADGVFREKRGIDPPINACGIMAWKDAVYLRISIKPGVVGSSAGNGGG